MRLREQSDVNGSTALCGVVEASLIGKDGLSRPRGTLNDVDPRFEQAAVKNKIEPRDTGPMSVGRRGLFAHSLSSRR
jgi:hypothetical protein